mgnify:CR=1 FL=1
MIEERLRKDTQHEIKAVCVVHNETSTGVTSNIAAVRKAFDAIAKGLVALVGTSAAGVDDKDDEEELEPGEVPDELYAHIIKDEDKRTMYQ